MMGAAIQMVNWRLSADQVRYTLEHAEARAILINSDFLPILEAIRDKLTHVQFVVVIAEQGGAPDTPGGMTYFTKIFWIKDVIKSGGEWVSSLDLENIMSQHEAVLECAAIGIPDEKWVERPLMLVVLMPEFRDRITVSDFKAHMKRAAEEGRLPKYGVPDRYEIVEEILKTSVGKLNKKVMRQIYKDL